MIVAVLLVATAVACAGGPEPTEPSVTATTQAPATRSVDVYYVVDTRDGLRLARERRSLSATHTVESAVRAMISPADDPDYSTTWNPATTVRKVSRDGNVVTVDVSSDARQSNVGSAGAALMIQQLVYTVTSATNRRDQVLLTINGEPAGDLWGVVSWTAPVRRASPLDVRQLVQIDSPREGDIVTSPVVVEGDAAVFEANLPWRVLNEADQVVARGNAMTSEGQRFAPYRFEVRLRPGTYSIEIREDDPSDGAAGPPMVDTRTVVVRGPSESDGP